MGGDITGYSGSREKNLGQAWHWPGKRAVPGPAKWETEVPGVWETSLGDWEAEGWKGFFWLSPFHPTHPLPWIAFKTSSTKDHVSGTQSPSITTSLSPSPIFLPPETNVDSHKYNFKNVIKMYVYRIPENNIHFYFTLWVSFSLRVMSSLFQLSEIIIVEYWEV